MANLASVPPFLTHESLYGIRKEIKGILPETSKLFSPFTFDASTFWLSNYDQAALNHRYEPFTVFLYVLRDHPREFKKLVDGMVIACQNDYETVKKDFNRVFHRIRRGGGRGRTKGMASVDEMIRIGSLFYILQRCCDQSRGLVLDRARNFCNGWNKRRNKLTFTTTHVEQYQQKLKNCYMSGFHWLNFYFRYVDQTDSDTTWFFHLPKFDPSDFSDEIEKELTFDDLLDIFNKINIVSKKGGYVFLTIEKTEEIHQIFTEFFSFEPYGEGRRLYRNEDFFMNVDFEESHIIVTNYYPEKRFNFRKVNES